MRRTSYAIAACMIGALLGGCCLIRHPSSGRCLLELPALPGLGNLPRLPKLGKGGGSSAANARVMNSALQMINSNTQRWRGSSGRSGGGSSGGFNPYSWGNPRNLARDIPGGSGGIGIRNLHEKAADLVRGYRDDLAEDQDAYAEEFDSE